MDIWTKLSSAVEVERGDNCAMAVQYLTISLGLATISNAPDYLFNYFLEIRSTVELYPRQSRRPTSQRTQHTTSVRETSQCGVCYSEVQMGTPWGWDDVRRASAGSQ